MLYDMCDVDDCCYHDYLKYFFFMFSSVGHIGCEVKDSVSGYKNQCFDHRLY